MKTKLNECPYCHHAAELLHTSHNNETWHRIWCPACGFRQPFYKDQEYVIQKWNRLRICSSMEW